MSTPRKRFVAAVVALLLIAPVLSSRAEAAATTPITGTVSNGTTFTGQLAINAVKVVNGQLVAVGTLTGQLLDQAGNLISNVAAAVTIPLIGGGGATCDILHLTLGPLDLTLLGLNVHLNQVVLDITATPGAGNLLGNLLCSVANLLNTGGPLAQIASLLNQILGLL